MIQSAHRYKSLAPTTSKAMHYLRNNTQIILPPNSCGRNEKLGMQILRSGTKRPRRRKIVFQSAAENPSEFVDVSSQESVRARNRTSNPGGSDESLSVRGPLSVMNRINNRTCKIAQHVCVTTAAQNIRAACITNIQFQAKL